MRGDIYRLRAAKTTQEPDKQERRYAVVLQADYLPLTSVLVAPTSTTCAPSSFRPTIKIDGMKTRVMVEQAAAVDVETRLGKFVGRVSPAGMQTIEKALRSVLALD